jgi:hypothetical protein
MTEGSATAEGDLARTPLAQLLVYALDRRLTGALFLYPPSTMGGATIVGLDRGVPVKVKPGDAFSMLGEMLIARGAIDRATLEAALATKGLLGDVLILAGRVERDVIESVAREQFLRRMVRLYALPPATAFRFHEGHEALAEYGGDAACEDPLAMLWAGIRIHGEVSALMGATLARIGDAPLRLHSAATVGRFGLDGDESRLLDMLNAGPATVAQLAAKTFPGMSKRFVYALAISRQLDVGGTALPVCADVVPSSSQRNAPAGASLGKVTLKSTVHRVGAAAPDAPGAGERVPPAGGSRRVRERTASDIRERTGSDPGIGEESGDRISGLPPISEVTPLPVDGAPSSSRAPDSGVVAVDPSRASSAANERGPTTMRREATAQRPAVGGERAELPLVEIDAEESPLATLSPSELLWLASDCLEEQDFDGAVEACAVGCKNAPGDPDLAALGAWARSHLPGADLARISDELDELVRVHENHADARYYRGMLRKRLGDPAGSTRDLARVLELAPTHEAARRELNALRAGSKLQKK